MESQFTPGHATVGSVTHGNDERYFYTGAALPLLFVYPGMADLMQVPAVTSALGILGG